MGGFGVLTTFFSPSHPLFCCHMVRILSNGAFNQVTGRRLPTQVKADTLTARLSSSLGPTHDSPRSGNKSRSGRFVPLL